MAFPRVLHAVALLLLQGEFPGAASETLTVREGAALNLRCTLSTLADNSSTLQWLNPRGFTVFLNAQRVLRDQRYKLLHYSEDELSIQLSNVTVQDEGVYRCFYYGRQFKRKSQNVEILAAPSHPVLEVSQDTGRGIELSCYTQGCKPQPQISWLLDNGVELPGDTRHKLGAEGKKWTTTSTLRVLAFSPNVTASCIIRHPALREDHLTASFHFQDLPSTGSKQPTSPSEDPADTNPSASSENPAVSSPSASPEDPAASSPSASPEDPAFPSSAPTPAQQNLTADATSNWPEETPAAEELGGSPGYEGFNGTEAAFSGNVTEEELARTEVPLLRQNVTGISTFTLEQNPKSKGIIKKDKNLLLPILVAALVFVLLIIVLFFMRKLKKAHGVWKRENDVSEQTLESYKSRSNEDSPSHEKKGQAANPKSNVQYVTEGYVETPEKNPGNKSIAKSEKMFECVKETDV